MVIYMEGSNSASIFEELLPKNIKIYALSAANPKESAFATYCYPDDVVKGEHMGTCLADVFSANFLEDIEKADLSKETLSMQFKKVQRHSKDMQSVGQHGDTSFVNEAIGNFFSNSHVAETTPFYPSNYSVSILQ
jgi:legumain